MARHPAVRGSEGLVDSNGGHRFFTASAAMAANRRAVWIGAFILSGHRSRSAAGRGIVQPGQARSEAVHSEPQWSVDLK